MTSAWERADAAARRKAALQGVGTISARGSSAQAARSSEQVAFELYGSLAAPDRRLVDAWRALGNDLTTSCLNAGVFGSTRRVHPQDADLDAGLERLLQLGTVGSPARRRRRSSEHEAAHAIVAMRLGMRVTEVAIRDGGGGHCNFLPRGADPVDQAAVYLAADIWINDFRSSEYPEGQSSQCSDDRRQAGELVDDDDFRLRRAAHLALTTLKSNRAAVLELASRLDRDGVVDLSG